VCVREIYIDVRMREREREEEIETLVNKFHNKTSMITRERETDRGGE